MFAAALLAQPQVSSKYRLSTLLLTFFLFASIGRNKGGNVLVPRVEVQNRKPPPQRKITPNVQMAPYARNWAFPEEEEAQGYGGEQRSYEPHSFIIRSHQERFPGHPFSPANMRPFNPNVENQNPNLVLLVNDDPPEEEKLPEGQEVLGDDQRSRAASDYFVLGDQRPPNSKKRAQPSESGFNPDNPGQLFPGGSVPNTPSNKQRKVNPILTTEKMMNALNDIEGQLPNAPDSPVGVIQPRRTEKEKQEAW
jgi:hypothetical protein